MMWRDGHFGFFFGLIVTALVAKVTIAKETGSLYPASLVTAARNNCLKLDWAIEVRKAAVEAAQPWLKMTDDEIWDLMFSHTVKRSWMVFSSGNCPACKKSVPMYNWEIKAIERPWKTRCPHCQEIFPKNDFLAVYKSGLDEQGIFDPNRADRKLLINQEHPDPNDPLHTFGVDDGNGYAEGDKVWRFVAAYIIYGQWKQAVIGGIQALGTAYLLTGESAYAHKAGIILDRVADLYPNFDFRKQAFIYDVPSYATGYVSVWHDACEEVRMLALGYDQIFDGIKADPELARFLSAKAAGHKLANSKASFADIQRNIEDRIFRDTLAHRSKILSNQPRTEVAEVIMKTVLDWPNNRQEINDLIDTIIKAGTSVDGVTGEKGMAGYTTIGPRSMADLIGRFDRIDKEFLPNLLKRQPQLRQTYRFHIDTWCGGNYYPEIGDTGSFAVRIPIYKGIDFIRPASLEPSGYTLLWRLYEYTGDVTFVQALYSGNDHRCDGLPHDLFIADPAPIQNAVAKIIAGEGTIPKTGNINKSQWHLGILKTAEGIHDRAVWLDYDSGGRHSHLDGLNLGLFSHGLDLMPDFGYPPVQFGGWSSPRAVWYTRTAAHNTVVVDGKDQSKADGTCTLWVDGRLFRAIRATCPKMYDIQRYERTVLMADLSDRDSYLVDIFRVAGGKDHTKFMGSHFGVITTSGLSPKPATETSGGEQMRNCLIDPSPSLAWSADWKIDDRYKILPEGADVHLRYTDLTHNAKGGTIDTWIMSGLYDSSNEGWIPRVLVKRTAAEGEVSLTSTFVAVIEPYEKKTNISAIRRLPIEAADNGHQPESCVAVEVTGTAGIRDLTLALEESDRPPAAVVQKDWNLSFEGEFCVIRKDGNNQVRHIAIGKGTKLQIDDLVLKLKPDGSPLEFSFEGDRPTVISGLREQVVDILRGERSLWK